jgi:hypothetical protein
MKRPVARKRQLDKNKQKRKEVLVRDLWHGAEELLDNQVFVGKLLKGKVHCSCPMCATKTKINGWKASDLRKLNSISNNILKEYANAYSVLSEDD